MTQAVHHLDLLQWYMGRAVDVFAAHATFERDEAIDVEDVVAHRGRTERVRARRGIVPACGGFPASPQLRAQHLPAVLLRRYVGSGYLHRGRTPRELALSIGVDPAGLTFGYLAALHAAGPQRAEHCQPGGAAQD
ncbi:hypothetical protein GCM10027174_09060 [Salinifilum aidingensis]